MKKSNKGLRECLMEETDKNQRSWVVREDSQTCIETCRIGRDELANEEGNLQKKKQQVQGP